ncbi:MAG: DUF3995 domain-containing protein [Deinococcota bacterium]
MIVSAFVLASILCVLSGLHVYWAFGGRWGSNAVIPTQVDSEQTLFTPPPIATLVVAAALAVAALLSLAQVQLINLGLPAWSLRTAMWGLSAIFLLRTVGDFRYVGMFKRVRGTRFARMDNLLYSPLCLLLSILAANLARY